MRHPHQKAGFNPASKSHIANKQSAGGTFKSRLSVVYLKPHNLQSGRKPASQAMSLIIFPQRQPLEFRRKVACCELPSCPNDAQIYSVLSSHRPIRNASHLPVFLTSKILLFAEFSFQTDHLMDVRPQFITICTLTAEIPLGGSHRFFRRHDRI